MNKVDPECLEKVTGDARKIIEKNGLTAEEVMTDDDDPESLRVVRGDLCLEWGTRLHPGNGGKIFILEAWQQNAGWRAEICLDDTSWSGTCSNNAPPAILEYFQIYGVDNRHKGLDLAFESYEAGLVVLDRLVWAFVNRKPEFEKAIRTILDRHGIGVGQQIESPDAKGWQEERNSLFLNWGDLDADGDFMVNISTDSGSACSCAHVYYSDASGGYWAANRQMDPSNPFVDFMNHVSDDDIFDYEEDRSNFMISRPAAGLELVDRLVSMFVDYKKP
jgi:hypothetical protein